ncbi:MAG: hypothetical protein SOZ62_03420 [Eubacteriales bacterium]|nr:hypothetical protein [Eubacteriales bacterium]
MKFIKDNSYLIFKLAINQLGMAVFGLVLALAANKYPSVLLLVSFFAVAFYMVLIYTMMWEVGSKDGIRNKSRGVKCDTFKATKITLIANSFNIAVFLLILIGRIIMGDGSGYSGLYNVAVAIGGFAEAMYLGIVNNVVALFANAKYTATAVMYFIIIIPSLVSATLAYLLGYNDKRIFPHKKREK